MVPFTFLVEIFDTTPRFRPYMMEGLAACGIRNIVLYEKLLAEFFKDYTLIDTIQKEMSDAGLKFVDSHALFGPKLDLCTPEPKNRKIMVQRLLMTLEIISLFGVDTITVHVGNNNALMDEKYRSVDQNVERIEDALAQILPTAEKLGITVCIENIWYPTNTPEILLGIKEHFPTDALGFCFDAGHANICEKGYLYEDGGNHGNAWRVAFGKDPEVWDDKIGEKMLPHIVNCHLHDNMGQVDQHLCPGHGNVNWESVANLLRRAPRLKNIQSEVILARDPVSYRHLLESFRKILPECF